MKSFWGELQESVFFAYVKDIRQVEEDLLTYFSVGLEYTKDYKNAYFTSLGIFYHEDDWILHAEADYQWNNYTSNWIMTVEGNYRLDKNSIFTIGYRDILSGSPIEPYDNFDFRGLYAELSFQF